MLTNLMNKEEERDGNTNDMAVVDENGANTDASLSPENTETMNHQKQARQVGTHSMPMRSYMAHSLKLAIDFMRQVRENGTSSYHCGLLWVGISPLWFQCPEKSAQLPRADRLSHLVSPHEPSTSHAPQTVPTP